MDSRELYPSDEQRRRIMDFIMAAGETLLIGNLQLKILRTTRSRIELARVRKV